MHNGFEPRRGDPFILIVDDEPAVLEVTRTMACSLGWQPLLANTTESALRVFQDHADSIAHVLVDLHVKGVGGEVLVRQLRAIRPDVTIELMTGDEAAAEELLEQGVADGLLLKPFAIDDLEHALDAYPRAA